MGKNRTRNIEDVIQPVKIRSANLAEAFPEVAAEWYYKKNCGWGPEDFNYGSNIKVWWQCSNNKKHVYAAEIANRTTRKSGCKICNAGESTDLRDYPEALAQFDHEKNKGINPLKLPWHAKVHWKSVTNTLNVLFPRLAREWHQNRNGNLKPKEVSASSNYKAWWQCGKCRHEWQATVYNRARQNSGCPQCWIQDRPRILALCKQGKYESKRPKR